VTVAAVPSTGTTPPVQPSGAGEPAAPAVPASSTILPAPMVGSDPLGMIYLIESQSQQLGFSTGSAEIKGLQNENNQECTKELTAIHQEAVAAKHKSFWDKLGSAFGEIAKVAGVVASIAAAVATCGAASPLAAVAVAGAVLSTAGFADSEFGILKKLGVSSKLAGYLDAGMSIGGAVVSVGAGLLSGAQAAASTASTVSKVASGVGGVGQLGHGVSDVGSGQAQAADDKAVADQVDAQTKQASYQRMILQLLAEMQDTDQKGEQTLQTISGIKSTENNTALYAASSGMEGSGS
jgi:hypothetical protein